MLTSFPGNVPIRDDVVCLLYDRETGEIPFAHRVTTLGETEPPSAEAVEREAREILEDDVAGGFRRKIPTDLAALIVPADSLTYGRMYKVDLRDGQPELIEQDSRPAAD